MSERYTADTITDDALDQLYDERDRYFHFACAARGASGARDFPDLTDTILALVDRAEHAEATVARVQKLAEVWRDAPDPLARAMAADLQSTLRGLVAPHEGPSVAECTANDRAHWNDKYAGEQR